MNTPKPAYSEKIENHLTAVNQLAYALGQLSGSLSIVIEDPGLRDFFYLRGISEQRLKELNIELKCVAQAFYRS